MIFREKKHRSFPFLLLFGLLLLIGFLSAIALPPMTRKIADYATRPTAPASHVAQSEEDFLWRMGRDDLSFAEFGNRKVDRYTIPTQWKQLDNWPDLPSGLTENARSLDLTYHLSNVPTHGVELSLRVLESRQRVPQLAVYSNGILAGLIQTWYPEHDPLKFRQTYRLYIPKELLQSGTNNLRLALPNHPYGQDARGLSLKWDYLGLAALRSPATEPIHGRAIYLGSVIQAGDSNFALNPQMIEHTPAILKWLGIAYSGNTMRATYWSDVQQLQPPELQRKLLDTYRDLNMTVVANRLNTAQVKLNPDGSLDNAARENLNQFFQRLSNGFQYHEIDNEPGLFDRSKAVSVAIANYVNAIKPTHVKTVAPGWAYWPTGGDPPGWERDVNHRRDVEALTQLTNGHAYGSSYNDYQGGSFVENLRVYGNVVNDGFPKEFLVTETGTNDEHAENNTGASQPHAAEFDRILRAHIAVADRIMQHALFGGGYSMFQPIADWGNHEVRSLEVYPGVKGEESRLQTYRRLALAYATHGSPLPYQPLDPDAIRYKNVYFRAVDTSTLAPLPGSQGSSNKILLNFVNFENTPQRMKVEVTLPQSGEYQGERIGTGKTYGEATTAVRLSASPTLTLEEELPPRQAVQYILERG